MAGPTQTSSKPAASKAPAEKPSADVGVSEMLEAAATDFDGSDPEYGASMMDDASDDDVNALMGEPEGDGPTDEEGEPTDPNAAEDQPEEEQPAEGEEEQPQEEEQQVPPPKAAAAKQPTEIEALTKVVSTLSQGLAQQQQFIQQMPMLMQQQTQQFVASLQQSAMQRAEQQELQQRYQASMPKDPGPEAPLEDQLRYRAEKAEWKAAEIGAQSDQRLRALEQRLANQERGKRMENANQQIEAAMSTIHADPNYGWWTRNKVAADHIHRIADGKVQALGRTPNAQELQGILADSAHDLLRMMEWYSHHRAAARQAIAARGKKPPVPGNKKPGGNVVPLRGGGGGPAGGPKTMADIDKEVAAYGLGPKRRRI